MNPEIIEFKAKTDKNGNTARLRIDVANRKFYRNFTKQAVSKMVEAYKWFGWKEEKI